VAAKFLACSVTLEWGLQFSEFPVVSQA